MAGYLERLGPQENAQEMGQSAQETGQSAQEEEQTTDAVNIPRLKLLEMQERLADCQSILKQYLTKASE